ncbi:Hypothetical predicted protein [Lecanosticta acicola]|uniref:Uncharacterized protein n=1 Tax=Lecanosticta acicola TaxID=111012 RepID=A0AAI8Z286_9PEZI|nr:Hypothetical predicted protein [Lecanosticta acicola]
MPATYPQGAQPPFTKMSAELMNQGHDYILEAGRVRDFASAEIAFNYSVLNVDVN